MDRPTAVKKTKIVRIRRKNGKIVQDCSVYIGRDMFMGGWNLKKSKWANPYKIGTDGNRDEVLGKYKKYVTSNTSLMNDLEELRGETLGCWCKPEKCHGDILVELLEKKP